MAGGVAGREGEPGVDEVPERLAVEALQPGEAGGSGGDGAQVVEGGFQEADEVGGGDGVGGVEEDGAGHGLAGDDDPYPAAAGGGAGAAFDARPERGLVGGEGEHELALDLGPRQQDGPHQPHGNRKGQAFGFGCHVKLPGN